MITLITGAPGAGKTAALVLMLQELLAASGRQIYVNGIPDLKIPHEVLAEPDKWHETVPDGAVIIIDEVQNVWRPRGPGQPVPDHVKKLETHRHRGIDFYIITQGPNLVDGNVRALVGRHVHLRDIGFLGRWWYEWPECADNCRTSWKNAPIKKKYKLPKKIFGQYKSASLHVKPIRSFPKMFIIAMIALVVAVALSWRVYSSLKDKISPPAAAAGKVGSLAVPVSANVPGVNRLVDESVDFTPRMYDKPWTAPAYDQLRKVVTLPTITGSICVNDQCTCYHNRRVIEMASSACLKWTTTNPFNPYELDSVVVTAPIQSPSPQPLSVAQPSI